MNKFMRMVCRKFLMVISGVIWAAVSLSQSCIIYKKEKDGVYVGIDSRIISYSIDKVTGRVHTTDVSTCKIDRVDKVTVAVTGHAANVAMDEAKYLLKAESSFDEAISRFTKTFGQKLADMLESERNVNPGFRKQFAAVDVLGGALFLYYENGVLTGRVTRIIMMNPPNQKASISTENVLIDSIGATGTTKGIRNVIFKPDIWKKGPVNGIKNLMSIEKFASPAQFDGIIDIVLISNKNDLQWIQRKQCQSLNP